MRYSRQRNIVLNIIKENHVHPTAEWVYEEAKEQLPQIGIATVYRNLNALAENGEILKISGIDGADRFDGNNRLHYHIRCRKCQGLEDLPVKDMEAFANIEKTIRNAFDVHDENAVVSTTLLEGYCSECRKCRKKEQ